MKIKQTFKTPSVNTIGHKFSKFKVSFTFRLDWTFRLYDTFSLSICIFQSYLSIGWPSSSINPSSNNFLSFWKTWMNASFSSSTSLNLSCNSINSCSTWSLARPIFLNFSLSSSFWSFLISLRLLLALLIKKCDLPVSFILEHKCFNEPTGYTLWLLEKFHELGKGIYLKISSINQLEFPVVIWFADELFEQSWALWISFN